jgi:hypothetical protein
MLPSRARSARHSFRCSASIFATFCLLLIIYITTMHIRYQPAKGYLNIC